MDKLVCVCVNVFPACSVFHPSWLGAGGDPQAALLKELSNATHFPHEVLVP